MNETIIVAVAVPVLTGLFTFLIRRYANGVKLQVNGGVTDIKERLAKLEAGQTGSLGMLERIEDKFDRHLEWHSQPRR